MLEADQIHDEKVVSNVKTMVEKADLEVSLSPARPRSLSISLSRALSRSLSGRPPPPLRALSVTLFRSLSISLSVALALVLALVLALAVALAVFVGLSGRPTTGFRV